MCRCFCLWRVGAQWMCTVRSAPPTLLSVLGEGMGTGGWTSPCTCRHSGDPLIPTPSQLRVLHTSPPTSTRSKLHPQGVLMIRAFRHPLCLALEAQ